ncbi:DUF2892 domain-containing protein [Streptococcus marmotae]|uniref:DUF2892 domain-containing protein n=1 Tax=Streptococcus marmotae TaxID=1825069 RepID=UPI000A8D82C4|nr:DUF2892 domain-containing protein [Streptococcus marmotae]
MEVTKEIEKKFAVAVVTPWIKGKMDVDNYNIMIDIPNTIIFGLVPAGRRKYTTPLGNVSNVYTSSSYKLGKIFIGLLLGLFGLNMLRESFLAALVVLAVAALVIASGILTVFSYENSGNSVTIPLPFFEAHHAQEFEEKVIAKINKYNDDRNGLLNAQLNAQLINNQQAQSTQQLVDALKNQNNQE